MGGERVEATGEGGAREESGVPSCDNAASRAGSEKGGEISEIRGEERLRFVAVQGAQLGFLETRHVGVSIRDCVTN